MKVRRSRASPPEAIDTLARSVARARRVPWRASGTPTVGVHVSGVATGMGSPSRAATSPAKPGVGDPPPRKRMKGPVCAGVATGCSTIAPAKAAHANGRGVMRATFRQRTSALRSRRIGLLREDANFGPVLLVHAIDRLERGVGRVVEPEQVAVLVLLGVGAERERLGAVVLPGAGPLEALARLEFQLPAL